MLSVVRTALEQLNQNGTVNIDGYMFTTKNGQPIDEHLDFVMPPAARKSLLEPGHFGTEKYFDGPQKRPHLRTFSLLRMFESMAKQATHGVTPTISNIPGDAWHRPYKNGGGGENRPGCHSHYDTSIDFV